MDKPDGDRKQEVIMVCTYHRLSSQKKKVYEAFKQLEETPKLHIFMEEFWDICWQSRTAECRKSGEHQIFFSAGTPLSSEVALLDVVWTKEEMDRDIKADDSFRLSGYEKK